MRAALAGILFLAVSMPADVCRAQSGAIDTVRVTASMPRAFVNDLTYGITAPARWNVGSAERFAGATAIVVAVGTLDGSIRSMMLRNQTATSSNIARVIEPFGAQASLAVVGAFALGGVVFHNETASAIAAESAASSIIAAGLITPALKEAFGRPRPRAGENTYDFDFFGGAKSFPSGHTTQAFAIASVIATEYDKKWIDVAAYTMASGVAAARMYHGAHYLSDVTAGAFIGAATGRMIARHAHKLRKANEK